MTVTVDISAGDLRTLGEDCFLHGHLLSNWILDYVDLEESLAVGSIAQENLAHCSWFLSISEMSVTERDLFIFTRAPAGWNPAALLSARLHHWPATVLRGLLLGHAAVVRCERFAAAKVEAVSNAGKVIGAEQLLHAKHWERWTNLLLENPRTRTEFAQCIADVFPMGTDVFGEADGDAEEAAGMHSSWVERVASVNESLAEACHLLGSGPTARVPGERYESFVEILSAMRGVRRDGDGVRGLYQ